MHRNQSNDGILFNLNILKPNTHEPLYLNYSELQNAYSSIFRCNRAFKQKLIGCKLHCCINVFSPFTLHWKIFLPMPLPINISIQPMNLLGQNRDKNIYLKCTNNRSHRNHQRNVIRNGKCIHQYKELAIHLSGYFLLCETSWTTWLNIHNSIEFTFFLYTSAKIEKILFQWKLCSYVHMQAESSTKKLIT